LSGDSDRRRRSIPGYSGPRGTSKSRGMTGAPSVLLLDDGELDRVQTILQETDADYLRLKGREIGRSVTAPLDLLVTSGRRALNEMPRVDLSGEGASDFTWVCLHNQDFLPLRQRLRELGVHFLVQAALDQESLRLFVTQLLYRGAERRTALRLPLGGEVKLRVDSVDQRARLVELSREGCRIQSAEPLAVDSALRMFLPASLGGGQEVELPCRVMRRVEAPGRGGRTTCSAVLRFEGLAPEAAAQLESLTTGRQIGTRLTPLADGPPREVRTPPAPSSAPAPDVELLAGSDVAGPEAAEMAERRGESRVLYSERVQAFTGDGAPRLGLGRDLSADGIFVEGRTGLAEGARVALALYGSDRRGAPILVDARVVRNDGGSGIGLRFESVTPAQRVSLEKLAGQLPPVRSLADDKGVIVSRLTHRAD
jgi:hypothetical protein